MSAVVSQFSLLPRFGKGDVNCDDVIDIIDVQLVASAFGTNTPAYDFDNSGQVDVFDIQLVASRWQVGC